MANSTLRGYQNIHGGNPQFLVEKVIRQRIYDSSYWKEHCFALTAESLIDKAIGLKAVGGVFGNQKPTPFLCLTLKLLQLQPEKEILIEYLLAEEFKYLRALAAFYVRLTFKAVEVYEILEPLLKDYKKLRIQDSSGFSLSYFDSFIDELLTEERVCDIILPRLTKRDVLEDTEGLALRKSVLEDAMGEGGSDRGERSDDDDDRRGRSSQRRGSNDTDDEDSDAGRFVSRSPSGSRSRSRSRSSSGGASFRSMSRSISPERLERMMRQAVGSRAVANEGGDRMEVVQTDDYVEGDV